MEISTGKTQLLGLIKIVDETTIKKTFITNAGRNPNTDLHHKLNKDEY